MAVRSGGKISVENLGLPYNSSMDDFGFSIDEFGNIFLHQIEKEEKGMMIYIII